MLRYVLTAAGVLALVSSAALAESYYDGSKSVTITRHASPEFGPTAPNRTITKRYINHRGMMVTKSKSIRDGFSGSSVSRTKTVHDPVTGETRTRTMIER